MSRATAHLRSRGGSPVRRGPPREFARKKPRRSILVVEDDPDAREAIATLLEQAGYAVTQAADGREALGRLRGASPPSLIVLDLMLPVMDGFEFRVQQLQDPTLAGIPVIVLSGGGDLEHKALGLQAEACLAKPPDPDSLLTAVARRFG